jgi:hypothetical protein
MIPLLTVGVVQPRLVIVQPRLVVVQSHLLAVEHDLLPQSQQVEEGMILDQFRGLRVGEWTEIVDLHHQLLVMDEIGMINSTIIVKIAAGVNERDIAISRSPCLVTGRCSTASATKIMQEMIEGMSLKNLAERTCLSLF